MNKTRYAGVGGGNSVGGGNNASAIFRIYIC